MADTVANAYVQIIPSAKGIKEGITDAIAPAGAAAGERVNKGFLGALSGLGAKVAQAAKVAAVGAGAAMAAVTTAAVNSYADYEQLVGGIETLYGDAADRVLANAQNAFRTAGQSANQYMETATSFAGALLQSVGGDTVEAARMADMAITDMSDNANKMGVDIERLQDAYRGFSRGNFTMLDNLSLGYGGTRAEMQRLLEDAEALSGVHYDIDSYADIVDAIHVIQTEMGITGTTAAEAASTISGSWGMLTASWSNLLTSLAGGGDDLETAIKNVFDSLGAWLGNLLPRIAETVRGIFAALPIVAQEALSGLPELVLGVVEEAFGTEAADVVQGLIDTITGLSDDFSGLVDGFAEFGSGIMEALSPLTEFFSGEGETFASMLERIQGHFADLGPAVDELSTTWGVLSETFTAFIEAVAPLVTEFIAQLVSAIVGLLPIIVSVVEAVATVVNDVLAIITAFMIDAQSGFEGLRSTLSTIWEAIKTAATTAWEGVKTAVINVWNGIKTGVSDAVNNVKTTVSNVFNSIKSTVSTVWNGIKSAITTPINAARDAVASAIGRIKSLFNFTIRWPHIPLPHFSVSGSANPLDWLTGGVPRISISWYKQGGMFDGSTIYGVGLGDGGTELAWPSYEPYLSKYADAIVSAMDGAGGGNTYVINGYDVRADAQLEAALEVVAQRVGALQRMGVVR